MKCPRWTVPELKLKFKVASKAWDHILPSPRGSTMYVRKEAFLAEFDACFSLEHTSGCGCRWVEGGGGGVKSGGDVTGRGVSGVDTRLLVVLPDDLGG